MEERISVTVEAIENAFEECYKIAKDRGLNLPNIPIKWDLKGTTAGMFCYRNFTNFYFRVNIILAQNNLDDYVKQVVPHEFAHYIVYYKYFNENRLYLKKPRPHGSEWKYVMEYWFGLNPDRCHRYDTSAVRRTKKKMDREFVYACGCSKFKFTAIRHRRAQSNNTYVCRACRKQLKYVGKE